MLKRVRMRRSVEKAARGMRRSERDDLVPGPLLALLHERTQARVLLLAGGTALKVGPHSRNVLVGGHALEFEVDVLIELLEALVAEQLRIGGAEQPFQDGVVGWLVNGRSPLDRVEREASRGEV